MVTDAIKTNQLTKTELQFKLEIHLNTEQLRCNYAKQSEDEVRQSALGHYVYIVSSVVVVVVLYCTVCYGEQNTHTNHIQNDFRRCGDCRFDLSAILIGLVCAEKIEMVYRSFSMLKHKVVRGGHQQLECA